jgi:SAM-dependent methyltransferase
MSARASCRFCGATLRTTFVDLGMSPLCERYVDAAHLNQMEPFYPLHVWVCDACWLVQLEEYVSPQAIFTEYAYFSSYADTWLAHVRRYAEDMIDRYRLDGRSLVVELASNDGYLLQYFVRRGIPVLGVEPARNVARVAEERGIPTLVEFFDERCAARLAAAGKQADLVVANNVLAHVPDLNGFVEGIRILLKPSGVVTAEFPHLVRLVAGNQFDTIYHEHFSYLSLTTIVRVFAAHGLGVVDVEELPTHGGTLRIYGMPAAGAPRPAGRVDALLAREEAAGVRSAAYYHGFARRVAETKRALLRFLIDAKAQAKSIAGYGAPGKGNTLLNYCGIRTDFLDFTVDRNPYKQGRYLPGTHIPIFAPERIREARPDYVLILPWNVKDEIMEQTAYIREWGGRFVVPIPSVGVYP